MTQFVAAYVKLQRTGELAKRAEEARRRLAECRLCPRECGANRLTGSTGACQTGVRAVVSSCFPHFGEEEPLVGRSGSGTIFFAWCNLRCVFCQNSELSAYGEGQEASPDGIAAMMLGLQEQGCHNINLVSPTHAVAQILEALELASQQGLRLPLVYNSGGYESVETLKLLDGVVDIYMPDMKYADAAVAERYSGVPHYPQVNRAAVKEMHRQVGDLVLDTMGIAQRGVLVRHLVLPGGLAGTGDTARFLAHEVSPNTYFNIMDQYRPRYRAAQFPPLDRPISRQEYRDAIRLARNAGLHRLDTRESRRVYFSP